MHRTFVPALTAIHLPWVLGLALAPAGCGGGPTGPVNSSIVGNWDMVGFTDGERVATVSGRWVFFDDGVVATDIAISFPEEPTRFIASVGRYTQVGDSLALELRGQESTWALSFTETEARFVQRSPDPADNTITLRRLVVDTAPSGNRSRGP